VAWAVLYFITPVIVPLVWLRNRTTDPGTPSPGDVLMPQGVRLGMGVLGAGILAVALFLFLAPAAAQSLWPWDLTPLTARVVGGWFALPGSVGLSLAADSRWSAWRITLQSQLIGIALILLAVLRGWGDFHFDRPMTPVFLLGMTALLLGLLGLYRVFETRRRQGQEGTR